MCELGLVVLDPSRGLDALRGGVHAEGALAGVLELVGWFSLEHVLLVKKRFRFGQNIAVVRA